MFFEVVFADNGIGANVGSLSYGADVMQSLQKVNWAAPTWDLFIIMFFVLTVFLYGMSLGRDRVVVILVSIYMALAVVTNAPILGKLDAGFNFGQWFAFKVTTFLGLFVVLFFMMSRSALQRAFGKSEGGAWWQVMIFSVFHVGLLVSITLSFLPPDAVGALSPLTRQIFASEVGRFCWLIAPILAMTVIKVEDK